MAHHSNTLTRLVAKERKVICRRKRRNHCGYLIVFLTDPCHARLDYEHSRLEKILYQHKYPHALLHPLCRLLFIIYIYIYILPRFHWRDVLCAIGLLLSFSLI